MEVNFFRFLDTPATESKISSSGNVFLNELFITYCGDQFLSYGNRFLLFNLFIFSSSGNLLELVENPFLGKTLFPLEGNDFLSTEKCFLLFRASFLQKETVTGAS